MTADYHFPKDWGWTEITAFLETRCSPWNGWWYGYQGRIVWRFYV